MDDRRFDSLTRLVGQGASRRTILRGLLGVGGAAVAGQIASKDADARTARTRPTIPPPPAHTTPPPTTTTAPPCAGQEQCPNSTLCCPIGTCARSGNQAICCTGHVCGLECCSSPYECCGGECCAAGHTCLTTVFAEGPNVEEEVCCPAHLACDNQCCDGACYSEYSGPVWYEDYGLVFNGHPVAIAGTSCCPAGGTVCGVGFPGYECCGGETPKCCHSEDESPGACWAEGACCNAADCAADNPGTDPDCWTCDAGTCVPIDNDAACGMAGEVCCDQVCCAAGQICVVAADGAAGSAQEAHSCVNSTTTTTTPEPTYQLVLYKRVAGTLAPLPGACFAIYAGSCPETGSPFATGCVQEASDSEPGRVAFLLPAGDYCIVETQVPPGYQPYGSVSISLTSNASYFIDNVPVTTSTTGMPTTPTPTTSTTNVPTTPPPTTTQTPTTGIPTTQSPTTSPPPPTTTTSVPGGGCFAGSTLIAMANGSSKRIDQIVPGDKVLGMDGAVNRVTEVLTPLLGDRALFALDGGSDFMVTDSHPLMTEGGWQTISQLLRARGHLDEHGLTLHPGPHQARITRYLADTTHAALSPYSLADVRFHEVNSDPLTQLYHLSVGGNQTYIAGTLVVRMKIK